MTEPLWPESFLGPDLGPDHCRDVLEGCYDVPFNHSPEAVIDIGANVGAFVRWAHKRWPRSIIHTYEPHPDNFHKATFGLANSFKVKLDQIKFHNVAVLDNTRTMPLVFEGHNCGEHSLFRHSNVGKPKQSVNVQVIDAATLPKADILKIDAEGAETAILCRLHQVKRLQNFTCVMYEFHDATGADYLDSLMRANGFTQLSRINHSLHRGITKWMRQ